MEQDLITIIIPIYNVEKYIEKCINSAINQTYKNLEIILVDDGSKDSSGYICDEFAKKDNRIIVIHKENGGLSDARNKGLDIAKGKYIFLLDGDDSINDCAIEYLHNLIVENNADIATSIWDLVYINKEQTNKEIKNEELSESQDNITGKLSENQNNTNEKLSKNKNNDKETSKSENNVTEELDNVQIFNNEEALEEMLYNTKITNAAINKLYKKSLFDDIRYPLNKLYEDLATTYKLIAKSNSIVLGNKKMYNYLVNRPDSIMNMEFKKSRMQALDFTEEMLEFVEKNYPNLKKAAIARVYIESIFILLRIPNSKEYANENKRIKKILRKYRFAVLTDIKMPIKQKMLSIICMFGRHVLRIAWKIKEKIKAYTL